MWKWVEAALAILFPPRCAVCRRESEETLCAICGAQIKYIDFPRPFSAVGEYEGILRKAIHKFKFRGKKVLAKPLGDFLVNYLSSSSSEINTGRLDAIIPTPLHPKRLRERGFNQVSLLAQVVSDYYGVPLREDILLRRKYTKPQFGLKKEERFTNIRGAFRVENKDSIDGKKVLLVDDIYTTGATIIECIKVLRGAGAKRVKVLTLSRAV